MGASPEGPIGSGISMYISLPQGGGGHLTVDPSGVETLIKYLDQALTKLREIERGSRRLTHMDPPGEDPFSPIAVADAQRTAGEEPGGHLHANLQAQEVFQATLDNLRASLAAYRATEAENVEKLQGRP